MDYINKIFNMDCLAGMSMYPDKSMDMILCDLPYGITGCRWDSLLPFDELWKQYTRIIKDNGAIVLTACQPFTTQLIGSQPKLFRYCWYWYKNMVTGFANARKQPLRCVEEVCVFYKHPPTYNPQGIIVLDKPVKRRGKSVPTHGDSVYRMDGSLSHDTETRIVHYPRQVLEIKCERGLHPTQKPVTLFEYFIQTYTNPGSSFWITAWAAEQRRWLVSIRAANLPDSSGISSILGRRWKESKTLDRLLDFSNIMEYYGKKGVELWRKHSINLIFILVLFYLCC